MDWFRCGVLGVAGVVVAVAQTSVGFDLNDQGNAAGGRGSFAETERLRNEAAREYR